MIQQILVWPPLGRRLRNAPGYLWHRSYFEFPLRIGLVVAFESRSALMEFAKTDEHRAIMHWLVGTDEHSGHLPSGPTANPVVGGFIRILEADDIGYANGTWSAEHDQLQVLTEWSRPAPGETPPPVLSRATRATIQGVGVVNSLAKALVGSGVDTIQRLRNRRDATV
ncbi:hypothetical protein [Auritidibacter ignavus]|uniref:hypothetical protein n=1 Tax=Auritidibacter ignavus TaxID=678932 RepID=UPI002FE6239E